MRGVPLDGGASLRERIPAALELQPMTKSQLSRCLSCTYSRIDQLVREMRIHHEVRIVGKVRTGHRRPEWLWEVA